MDHLPKGKYYVTRAGAARLNAEWEALQQKRGEVAENIRHARGFGDLSENFEYHEAKREQGMVESRYHQLSVILPDLHVVEPEEVPTDRVCFGSVVRLREEDGEEWELTIVGPLEANPEDELISFQSPLGSALIGKALGETVETVVPAGTIRYEVVGIRPYDF